MSKPIRKDNPKSTDSNRPPVRHQPHRSTKDPERARTTTHQPQPSPPSKPRRLPKRQRRTTPNPTAPSHQAPSQRYEADTSPPGHTTDTTLARRAVGWPVAQVFDDVMYVGEVTAGWGIVYKDGGLAHEVHWRDGDVSDLSWVELLHAHDLYNQSFPTERSPPSLPQGTVAADENGATLADLLPQQQPMQPPPAIDFPTPASYLDYELLVPHDDQLLRAKVLSRTISSGLDIVWTIRVTRLNQTTFTTTLPHATINNIITQNKRTAKIKPPAVTIPTITAVCSLANRPTSTNPYWSWQHPTIGLAGLVHIPSLPIPTTRKRQRAPRHTVTVIAVAGNDYHRPSLFLCVVQDRPDVFVYIDSAMTLANAVHGLEVQRLGKRRGNRSVILTLPDQPSSTDLPALSASDLRSAINQFADRLPDDPTSFFQLGLTVAHVKVPRSAERHYRRAHAVVVEMAKENSPNGWKMLQLVNAMLLTPKLPEGVSRVESITQRARLFLNGEFDRLLCNDSYDEWLHGADPVHSLHKSPSHKPKPPQPLSDERDQQANQAVHMLTKRHSVKQASARLFTKQSTEPALPGVLTRTLQKLHPQPGEPAPDPPYPSVASSSRPVQGGGDRQPPSPSLLGERVRRPLRPGPAPPFTATPATARQYMDVARRRDPGTAGGPCGTTFLHLRTLLKEHDTLTENLTEALNLIATNRLNIIARRLVNASRCVPIPKDEPGEVRPIAVGSAYLRLAQAVALAPLSQSLNDYFMPHQYGIGVKGGAELMIHAIRSHLELNPNHVAISCDARNAFNSVSRHAMWSTIDQHFPTLSHILRFSYGIPTQVIFAEPNSLPTTIDSTVGSRQGCVFGSLSYCLALHPLLLQLASEYPDLLIISYVDDLHILGDPTRVAQAFQRYSNLYSEILQGELRPDKSHCYSPRLTQSELASIHDLYPTVPVSNEGYEVLGAPVGGKGFVKSYVETKITKICDAIDLLGCASLNQAKFIILQKSLSHKITHLQRTLNTGDPSSALFRLGRSYDLKMRALIQSLLPKHPKRVFLDDVGWELATLPLSLGGLGVQSFQHTADVALLASYTTVSRTIPRLFSHLTTAFPDLSSPAPPPTASAMAAWCAYQRLNGFDSRVVARLRPAQPPARSFRPQSAPPSDTRTLQHKLSEPYHETRHANLPFHDLVTDTDFRHRAQNLSNQGDVYGFAAMPHSDELTINNRLYGISICRRLLLPIYCTCEALRCTHNRCKVKPDEWGDHCVACPKSGQTVRSREWHDKAYYDLYLCLKTAGFNVKSDKNNSLHNALQSDSQKRPDILLLNPNPARGDSHIDYTTVSSTRRSIVRKAASTQGTANDAGCNTKVRSWHELCAAQGDTEVPVSCEDGGLLSEEGVRLYETAAKAAGDTVGERAAFLTYWRQRHAIVVMRGVASTIIANEPRCSGAHQHINLSCFSNVNLAPMPAPQTNTHTPTVCQPCTRLPQLTDSDEGIRRRGGGGTDEKRRNGGGFVADTTAARQHEPETRTNTGDMSTREEVDQWRRGDQDASIKTCDEKRRNGGGKAVDVDDSDSNNNDNDNNDNEDDNNNYSSRKEELGVEDDRDPSESESDEKRRTRRRAGVGGTGTCAHVPDHKRRNGGGSGADTAAAEQLTRELAARGAACFGNHTHTNPAPSTISTLNPTSTTTPPNPPNTTTTDLQTTDRVTACAGRGLDLHG